jgi:hypothetical protein
MRKPWPSGSSVTAASVASSVGVYPPACNPKASAMVKQPACAAAISSSGLVPFSFSNRVLKEYGVSANTPESVERCGAGATGSAPNRFRLADHLNLRLGLSGRSLAVLAIIGLLSPTWTAIGLRSDLNCTFVIQRGIVTLRRQQPPSAHSRAAGCHRRLRGRRRTAECREWS